MVRNENVEPAGHDQPNKGADKNNVHKGKPSNMQRIHPVLGVEVWVGKGEYDRNDRCRVVLKNEPPNSRDLPLAADGDRGIKISAQLIALKSPVSKGANTVQREAERKYVQSRM